MGLSGRSPTSQNLKPEIKAQLRGESSMAIAGVANRIFNNAQPLNLTYSALWFRIQITRSQASGPWDLQAQGCKAGTPKAHQSSAWRLGLGFSLGFRVLDGFGFRSYQGNLELSAPPFVESQGLVI